MFCAKNKQKKNKPSGEKSSKGCVLLAVFDESVRESCRLYLFQHIVRIGFDGESADLDALFGGNACRLLGI